MIPNDRFARFRNEVFKLLDGRGTLSDPTLIFSNHADSAEVEKKTNANASPFGEGRSCQERFSRVCTTFFRQLAH